MALLEYRNCPRCGHSTWQEFTPLADADSSYWRCRDCGDRRAAKRVRIDETALLHRGRLQTATVCADVLIRDISRDGARLCLDEDMPVELAVDQTVAFNPQLQPFGELAHYIPSVVRWIKGYEFGLLFTRPLAISSGDIRRIVKN
jgi:DNA-directed RNA polymerase subunit RPC12/RpoP